MSGRAAYRRGVAAFAVTFIGLGIAMIAVTASRGGGRLYLLRKR